MILQFPCLHRGGDGERNVYGWVSTNHQINEIPLEIQWFLNPTAPTEGRRGAERLRMIFYEPWIHWNSIEKSNDNWIPRPPQGGGGERNVYGWFSTNHKIIEIPMENQRILEVPSPHRGAAGSATSTDDFLRTRKSLKFQWKIKGFLNSPAPTGGRQGAQRLWMSFH